MSEGQQAEPDVPQRYSNNTDVYQSESEVENDDVTNAIPNETANNQVQKSRPAHQAPAKRLAPQAAPSGNAPNYQVAQQSRDEIREKMGYRAPVIRESRIKDRPPNKPAGDSAVKIKIELDLEVEVDLYARVKGDVTIGLM